TRRGRATRRPGFLTHPRGDRHVERVWAGGVVRPKLVAMRNAFAERVGAARADIAAIPAHPYKQQERFPAPCRVWRLAPHPPQKIVLIVPDCTQRTVAIAERETGNRFRALVFRWLAAL